MVDIIHKKIFLEHFKSRVPGLVPSVGEIDGTTTSNWGKIPCDLVLDDGDDAGLKELRKTLNTFFDKEEYRKFKGQENTNTIRLRYQDLMLWFYRAIDIFKKNTIYRWSVNNAIIEEEPKGEWIEYGDFNVYEKFYNLENIVDDIKLVTNQDKQDWDINSVYVVVSEKDKTFFEEHSGFELISLTQSIIGRVVVPSTIKGNRVPNFIYYADMQDMFDVVDKIKNADEGSLLQQKYLEMGGDDMYHFLRDYLDVLDTHLEKNKVHNLIPYFDIPLVITTEIEDLGITFNDEQEWVEGNKYYVGDIVSYNGDSYTYPKKDNEKTYNEKTGEIYFDFVDITRWKNYFDYFDYVEETLAPIESTAMSQLFSFRTKRNSYNDDGYELEGIIPYDSNDSDFEYDEAPTPTISADGYVHLSLPFLTTPINVVEVDGKKYGDVIYKIVEENNVVRFDYVIGGELDENNIYKYKNTDEIGNGIEYTEAYIFSLKESREYIDGNVVKIKYMSVNYDLNIDNGSTNVILSKIRYKPNAVWDNGFGVTVPTFRKDYLLGMSEYPTEDVNIVIDRGLSHAFEKHLMLTETNTFNDIKNYKNNYFNLN